MKALTFKKSALAAALLATAGAAQATASLEIGKSAVLVTATPQTTIGAQSITAFSKTVASQAALAGAVSLGATGTDQTLIEYVVPQTGADLLGGSLITFEFKNAGVAETVLNAPKIFVVGEASTLAGGKQPTPIATNTTTAVAAEYDNIELFQAISASPTDSTLVKLIYRVKDGKTVPKGTALYLVDHEADDVLDTPAGFDALSFTGTGTSPATLQLSALKGVASGAKATVKVTADNSSAVINDSVYSTKEVQFAEVFDGLHLTKFGQTISTVDFANNALTFVGGSKVSSATGLKISVNADVNKDKTLGSSEFTDVQIAATDVDLALAISTTKCDMLATTNGLTLKNSSDQTVTLTKTASGCGWTAAIDGATVDLTKDFTLAATVNGTTALTSQNWNVTYEAKVGAVGGQEKTSNDALVWSTNVQTQDSSTVPFLTAFNNSTATFSLVKVDNQAETSDTDVVIKGMVEQITFVDGKKVSEFLPFDNYYLGKIAAKSLGQFSGDNVIDALLVNDAAPTAPANFGFKAEALAGLKKDAVHHMSVTFSVSTATTKNGSIGEVTGYNASNLGRTNLVVK